MQDNFTRVKISDIARRAGVSAGTVDRVIHNRGEVAGRTREKVLEILREMNYEPDILASTLASKKTFRFATLLPETGQSNPFWEKPAQGLQAAWEEVRHFGVVLEKYLFTYYDQDSFSNNLDRIIENRPDGLIMSPVFSGLTRHYMEMLDQLKVPVVFLNTQIEDQNNIAFVGQDPVQSGMVAARLLDYCVQDGEDIFIINIISEKGGNSHIFNREGGFREYFIKKTVGSKNLITINISSQIQSESEEQLAESIGHLNLSHSTKGLFVTNSRVFHVADFIKKSGIRNIRLIGYDLLEQNISHLRNNTIDFLIGQKPWEQGYKSLMAMFNTQIMKKEIGKNQFLPIDIITKENIDIYLNN